METFQDYHGDTVRLAFEKNSFSKPAKHVLAICRYKGQWLLTKHKQRGLEFPGGKVEAGETLEEAVRREVQEETGAILGEVQLIGEYEVESKDGSFVKAIFYGEAKELQNNAYYYETEGPQLVGQDLLEKRFGEEFSFIMKDSVIEKSIRFIGFPTEDSHFNFVKGLAQK
ncbi:RNA deprotection pyrophosphohydrolase [Robertmurraya andreesenii]|uniref:8-oxo-dGTP diphosphatase n=1 Tax=Anoxybacillus andreesenii TaxID=1325932 RepID=A0ABT9VA68_9BACL|nr:nucleoside triphosphatase YtkD [Robertmurraya andreesenii]MDQ0157851.1 8-oxo-dGTP diphosphatase [Robertmurraya andreesenii]